MRNYLEMGNQCGKSQTGGLVRWENHGTFCVGYNLLISCKFWMCGLSMIFLVFPSKGHQRLVESVGHCRKYVQYLFKGVKQKQIQAGWWAIYNIYVSIHMHICIILYLHRIFMYIYIYINRHIIYIYIIRCTYKYRMFVAEFVVSAVVLVSSLSFQEVDCAISEWDEWSYCSKVPGMELAARMVGLSWGYPSGYPLVN